MHEIIQANMIIAFSNYHWSQMGALTNVQQCQGVKGGFLGQEEAKIHSFIHDSGGAHFQQVVPADGQILDSWGGKGFQIQMCRTV